MVTCLSVLLSFCESLQDDGIRTLSKDDSAVVVWSPDGKLVVWRRFFADESLPVCDAKTGKILRRIPTGDQALGLAFSPDSTLLATADGFRHTVRLWNAATGKLARELKVSETRPKQESATFVKFSVDGKLVAAAGSASLIPIWEVGDGKLVKTLHTQDSASDLAVLPDSKTVAYATTHGMKTWSIGTDQLLFEFKDPTKPITGSIHGHGGIAFSPTRYLLVLATSGHEKKDGADVFERRVEVWDYQKKELLYVLRSPLKRVFWGKIAFSPDGETFAAVDSDGKVGLWNSTTRKEVRTLPIESVRDVAFGPEGKSLAVAAKGGVFLCAVKPTAGK